MHLLNALQLDSLIKVLHFDVKDWALHGDWCSAPWWVGVSSSHSEERNQLELIETLCTAYIQLNSLHLNALHTDECPARWWGCV